MRGYAIKWLGGADNVQALAKRISPINYIRPGLPPILTLHGDKDVVVPYDHAVRLHKTLEHFSVNNRLYPLRGKEHFDFSADDMANAFDVIDKFLDENTLSITKPSKKTSTPR